MYNTDILNNFILLSSSNIGRCDINEDRLNSFIIVSKENDPIICFVLCDGVGSIQYGDLCAELLCNEISLKIHKLIEEEGRKLFYVRNRQKFKNYFNCLDIKACQEGASTLTILIANITRFKDGFRFLVLWAGDSRAHIIDHELNYHLLTDDHHDSEGRLTLYYDLLHNNFLGDPSCRYFSFKRLPVAFGVTSDGVHEKCNEEELRLFLLWFLYKPTDSNDKFSEYLSRFLNVNISDNYSASFLFKKTGASMDRLKKILENK